MLQIQTSLRRSAKSTREQNVSKRVEAQQLKPKQELPSDIAMMSTMEEKKVSDPNPTKDSSSIKGSELHIWSSNEQIHN